MQTNRIDPLSLTASAGDASYVRQVNGSSAYQLPDRANVNALADQLVDQSYVHFGS